jgi:hypothetical protein
MSASQLIRFTPSTQLSTHLEQVFLYTIELLQQMDQGIAYGIVPTAPEVLLWMIQKCEPEVFAELQSGGRVSEFITVLEHYRSIRDEAKDVEMERLLQFEAETNCDGNNWGHVSLDDVAEALSRSALHQDHPEIASFLKRVLSAARERSEWFWRCFHELQRADAELPQEARKPCTSIVVDAVTSTPSVQYDSHENGPLQAAVAHARNLMLLADTGQCVDFWMTVYAEVVGRWVEHDLPSAVAAVLQRAEASQFFDSIGQFIEEMREVERLWDMLSPQLRGLLLSQAGSSEALSLVRHVVQVGFSREDRKPVNRLAALVVEMLFRRATSFEPSDSLPVLQTTQNSPLGQRIREEASCETVAYLVSTADLPDEVRARTTERYALVVKVDSSQERDFPGQISWVRDGFDAFTAEQSGGGAVRMLAFSSYFWCREDDLLAILERFRLAIPVLYVGEKATCFVQYPCSYFPIHSRIHDRKLTRDFFKRMPKAIGGGFYSSTWSVLHVIVPLIVDSFMDWTHQQPGSNLSDAYKELRRIRVALETDRLQSSPVTAAFAELYTSATLTKEL